MLPSYRGLFPPYFAYEISHENIRGKRAASEGAGLNVPGPAKGERELGGEGLHDRVCLFGFY